MPHGTSRWSAIVPITFGVAETVGVADGEEEADGEDEGSGLGVPLPSTFLSADGSTCAHPASSSATTITESSRFMRRA